MSELHISRSIFEAIRAHGEETYPHECCGVLLGHSAPGGWRVVDAVRADNRRTDSAHNRYMIAPVELVKIQRQAHQRGLDIAGFYHSHPDHPAQWSPTDFAEAHWIGCSYVITEVAEGKAKVTNAFLLGGPTEEDKRFDTETIMVTDKASGGTSTP
jgi:proteasome lid subunit RPN8/RPN11